MGLDLEGGQSGPRLVHYVVSPALRDSGSWSWVTSLAYRDLFCFLLRELPQGSVCVCVHPLSLLCFALVLVDSAPRPALGGVGLGWGVGFSV